MTRAYEEKRKFPRHKVYTPGMLEMFEDTFPISVWDLSVGGLKIRSTIPVAPETYVAILINVGRDIVFHCQILWIKNMIKGTEHFYLMGLQIDSILDRGNEILADGEKEILIQDLIIILK
ncbi:MAG: PilZ domain-containing protein, partial [Deltaproteobacteria bacterium]|nr:PilZ domain-containing protein [Deltaproteobacteria bacterium]